MSYMILAKRSDHERYELLCVNNLNFQFFLCKGQITHIQ